MKTIQLEGSISSFLSGQFEPFLGVDLDHFKVVNFAVFSNFALNKQINKPLNQLRLDNSHFPKQH